MRIITMPENMIMGGTQSFHRKEPSGTDITVIQSLRFIFQYPLPTEADRAKST